MSISEIKPWFIDDLQKLYSGIYFAYINPSLSREERYGFVKAIASTCLSVGINPESFLAPEDIQLLRKKM